jgi:4-amino-4-deoxy-L-arabinose transferase-like glycosyltransferase
VRVPPALRRSSYSSRLIDPDDPTPRRFLIALAAIAFGGVVLRAAYGTFYDATHTIGGDALYYHWQGLALADHVGFVEPFLWRAHGARVASAYHPPLYSVFLGSVSWVGLRSVLAHRLASTLWGGVTVAALGLLGRRLAGERAGLVAAGVAALYPPLWIADTQLLSEGPYAALLAVTALIAFATRARPTVTRSAALGAAAAAAALTRAEALLLIPVLVLPAVILGAGGRPARDQVRLAAAALAGAALLLAPWATYNATRFERPVAVSTGLGNLLAVSNCDETYRGAFTGYWSFGCGARALTVATRPDQDESEQDAALRNHALDYVRAHRADLPRVAAARVGRALDLYRPGQQLALERFGEDRGDVAPLLSFLAWYALVPLAVAGAMVLWRRGVSLLVPGAFALLVMVTVTTGYGTIRFRIPLDLIVPLLAAVAVGVLAPRLRRRAA